jgi:hypothetical protein
MDNGLNLELIQQECAVGQIKWTTHILERMQERNIEPSDVLNCINNGRIIEQYPDAYPYPACLILGTSVNNVWLHTVLGYVSGFVWIITVYEPDEDEWTNNFMERKE